MTMSGNDSSAGRRSFLKGLTALGGTVALGGVGSAGPDFSGDTTKLLAGNHYEPGSARPMSADLKQSLPSDVRVREEYQELGVMKIELPEKQSLTQSTRDLEDRLSVDFVEQDTIHETFATAAQDPLFSDQYAPQQCNAPTAWDSTLGSNDVTVAVVDQGMDYEHPGFEGRFGENKGKDFVYPFRDDPSPILGFLEQHGTHVGGIASATTQDGESISGLSNSKLLSARALSGIGAGATSSIADGIRWSADQGADIINLSLGGGGETDTMRNAINYAVDNGALPIAAAGNSGERGVSFPAAYENAVAISAVNDEEALAEFSQFGPKIDVTAPGANVLSTVPGGDHTELSGTSMACPAASGVAALGAAAADGDLSPQELRELLKDSARDIGLDAEKQGAGHVDAAAIVEQA
jgi:serine protease